MTGYVEWYEPKKGYGFIKTKNSSCSLFFHKSDFMNLNSTKQGDLLNFEMSKGEKGPKAVNIYV
mgnify:CR=1 FL=1